MSKTRKMYGTLISFYRYEARSMCGTITVHGARCIWIVYVRTYTKIQAHLTSIHSSHVKAQRLEKIASKHKGKWWKWTNIRGEDARNKTNRYAIALIAQIQSDLCHWMPLFHFSDSFFHLLHIVVVTWWCCFFLSCLYQAISFFLFIAKS